MNPHIQPNNLPKMIKRFALLTTILLSVLLFASCGESAEETRRKAELATEIVELRKQIDSTRAKIKEVKQRNDSLKALNDTTGAIDTTGTIDTTVAADTTATKPETEQ